VVGVVVNHDIVAIPIPVIAVGQVKRGDAEVEAAKPETAGIATFNAPPVPATEAAFKAAVFPGVIEVEAYVVAATVMSDPFVVAMDVGGVGVMLIVAVRMAVAVVVPVSFVPVAFVRGDMIGGGAMVRNVSAADVLVAVVVIAVFAVLGQRRQGENQGCGKNSGE
jgi:uncharacterized membrane protein